jgi:phosphoenolpyruvate-protein phosphotransferase (PTS system enzyme I)
MKSYSGKSIYNGIAIGKIFYYEKEEQVIKKEQIEDENKEIIRFRQAKEQAVEELQVLYQKALKEAGEESAAIFEVHAMMLEDEDYIDSVLNLISQEKVNAEYAVDRTGENFSKMFAEMEDEYFKARAIDIKDISERIISCLLNKQANKDTWKEPAIILAKDLSPSETVQMDKSRILGFLTELGSVNSHTAILARTMNIPALTGIPAVSELNGKMAVLDGYSGTLIIEPNDEILSEMRKKQQEDIESSRSLQKLKGQETKTLDGRKIKLYANIGSVEDVSAVLENDAEGIGLFRSEFLYLEKNTYPTEEEQFNAYRSVLEKMGGKKVIIRTLDIGADKQIAYFNLEKEENPAMGYRAIRICLDRTDIFKTQLRALLRASIYGNLAVMYPMIISVEEVKQIKAIVSEVQKDLTEQGIAYGEIEQGIMIETPAAVMESDVLAKEVSFFSIGTNDLTQYTLAIDRQNPKLDALYDACHPAVLKMIQMVINNGHKEGCWVGICGELGAELTMTETFIDMGIDELSVSSPFILPVRNVVNNICKQIKQEEI